MTTQTPIKPVETSTVKVDDKGVLLKDPKVALNNHVKAIQTICESMSNRNIVGTKREELNKNFKESIEAYIMLVSAAITNNLVDSDKTGILAGNPDKKMFKGYTGHINKIAKEFLAGQAKVAAQKGASLSETELAKLIETPYEYRPKSDKPDDTVYDDKGIALVDKKDVPEADGVSVVELECTDGSKVTVDKNDNTLYTDITNDRGEVLSLKRKILLEAYTWYETAKNIAVSIFGFVWGTFKNLGATVVVAVSGVLGAATDTGECLATGTISNLGKLKEGIMTAHRRARVKAYHQRNG